MVVFLGDKSRVAMEMGDWDGPALRRVDLWAAGQWLTCDDNMAFAPQFRREVAETAAWPRAGGGVPLLFAGLPAAAAHRRLVAGERLEVTWQFWREEDLLRYPEHAGTVFTAEVGAAELAGFPEDLAAVLGCDGGEPAGA